jgi:quercetin dioxygenase-like cupin family protein
MDDFPEFMRNPVNLVRAGDQHTPGIVGYVFDGADGSQIAVWTHAGPAAQEPGLDTHDFDEWLVVVQGEYELEMDGRRVFMRAGDEALIPRGTPHAGRYSDSVTRTIHAFGGHRADRELGGDHPSPGRSRRATWCPQGGLRARKPTHRGGANV